MGNYTRIILSGVKNKSDLLEINKFLTDNKFEELDRIRDSLLKNCYFGYYSYFILSDFIEFLSRRMWYDEMYHECVRLFVQKEEDFNYSEIKLNLSDKGRII